MTKQELNRDVKRLAAEIYRLSFEDTDTYFEYLSGKAKKEFERLYNADQSFEYFNLTSIKIMLRLNIAHNFIMLNRFGSKIVITDLI